MGLKKLLKQDYHYINTSLIPLKKMTYNLGRGPDPLLYYVQISRMNPYWSGRKLIQMFMFSVYQNCCAYFRIMNFLWEISMPGLWYAIFKIRDLARSLGLYFHCYLGCPPFAWYSSAAPLYPPLIGSCPPSHHVARACHAWQSFLTTHANFFVTFLLMFGRMRKYFIKRFFVWP